MVFGMRRGQAVRARAGTPVGEPREALGDSPTAAAAAARDDASGREGPAVPVRPRSAGHFRRPQACDKVAARRRGAEENVARLTGFDRMWDAYPNAGEGAEAAKRTIGGGADVAWIANTCVLRISRSFNYGGYPIPDRADDEIKTVRGADRMHYAFRVREFVRWIRRKLGPADFEHAYPAPGGGDVPSALLGKQGLIVFEVTGWTDATGHIDLWDGEACRNHGYFERASKVLLWEIADAPSGPTLTGSVGANGRNAAVDVRLVQQLLVDRGEAPGVVDGAIGPKTIAAIRRFQSRFLSSPDGRVDPGGRTFRELQGL